MNKLDKDYQRLLEDILDNGVKKNTRNGKVLSVFGRTLRHSMKDGFPLLTTKKMYFKGIVTELLWFLRGDTNIKYLVENDCNIWTGDAYKEYSNQFKGYEDVPSIEWFSNEILNNTDFANKWGKLGSVYGKQWRRWTKKKMYLSTDGSYENIYADADQTVIDQISFLINELKTNPDSRRLLVSAWNVSDLSQMILPPCHYSFQVYTREIEERDELNLIGKTVKYKNKEYKINKIPPIGFPFITIYDEKGCKILREDMLDEPIALDEKAPKRAISLMFNMRSNDVPLGLPFNIASYALLLEIIARMVNMVPDEVIANLGDAHIYQNQIDGVKEQLSREPYELPKLEINDGIKFDGSIDDVLNSCIISDFKIKNYQSHPSIKMPLSN